MNSRYALLALAALALPACEEDINDDSTPPAVTRRISVSDGGVEANQESLSPDLTPDGRYAVFQSAASLVPGDTNGKIDIYRKDVLSGAIVLVSMNDLGEPGDGDSTNPSISADGMRVAFESVALNLSPGGTDVDDLPDIYVRDLEAETTVHVSQAEGGGPAFVSDGSFSPSISGDGRYVVFASDAEDIVSVPPPEPGVTQVFRYDLDLLEAVMVSVSPAGEAGVGFSSFPSVSFDGRFVAFESTANDLVGGDTGLTDVFLRDLDTEETERISVEHPSNPDGLADGANANGPSQTPRITPDGRFVAFASSASDLVAGDSNGQLDVFLFDREVPTSMTRVSLSIRGGDASGASSNPVVSADGRFVAFLSSASNLVAGDLNGAFDHFLRNVSLGTTYRVSVRTGGAETSASSIGRPALTADGRHVLFASQGPDLVVGDANGQTDVFIRGPHY